ncbi:Translation initiation factor 2 subunit alpha [Frankliniella fusca]|uniref:Translation initiation factor 2 subunit alpha n=1 Tax=Frankliniella fusca TaxID=407009 RepID=A0AAE1GXY5_9NEOP|nr:Translation initiation factor 2 subunit alpha [Frankliniella fusca]
MEQEHHTSNGPLAGTMPTSNKCNGDDSLRNIGTVANTPHKPQNISTAAQHNSRKRNQTPSPEAGSSQIKQGNTSKLNAYQALRLKNVQENASLLKDLGVPEEFISPERKEKTPKLKHRKPKKTRSSSPCQSRRPIPLRGARGVARGLIKEGATNHTDLDSNSDDDGVDALSSSSYKDSDGAATLDEDDRPNSETVDADSHSDSESEGLATNKETESAKKKKKTRIEKQREAIHN